MKITVDALSFDLSHVSFFQRLKLVLYALLFGELRLVGAVTLDVPGSDSIDTGDTNDTK